MLPQDAEMMEQIDRDVMRTHPGLHFFSGDDGAAVTHREVSPAPSHLADQHVRLKSTYALSQPLLRRGYSQEAAAAELEEAGESSDSGPSSMRAHFGAEMRLGRGSLLKSRRYGKTPYVK